MSGRRDRSRSPNKRNQGGFQGKDRFKILLKNLPYEESVSIRTMRVFFVMILKFCVLSFTE